MKVSFRRRRRCPAGSVWAWAIGLGGGQSNKFFSLKKKEDEQKKANGMYSILSVK